MNTEILELAVSGSGFCPGEIQTESKQKYRQKANKNTEMSLRADGRME